MKIIFVRHGHPNYADDCLTPLGRRQARAAAERLKDAKIDRFYASSCGRAYETACYIAELHGGAEVEKLDFMREISWGIEGTSDHTHPWDLADRRVAEGKDVMDRDWQNDPDYAGHTLLRSYLAVAAAFDSWLDELGYRREGNYYRVTRENRDVLLLASHGGSSSAVLAHAFGLPFGFICHALRPGFTAITEVSLEGEVGALISPAFLLANDIEHIKSLSDPSDYNN